MGRKRLGDDVRKGAKLEIRMSTKERRALDRAAKREKLSTSTWARNLLLRAAGIDPNPDDK